MRAARKLWFLSNQIFKVAHIISKYQQT